MISEYFYWFGFVYMVDLLISLYTCFKPLTPEQKIIQGNMLVVDGTTTHADLSRQKERIENEIAKRESKIKTHVKSILSYALEISLYVWAIMGYVYETPEKNWFLFDVLVVTAYRLSMFFLAMAVAFTIYRNEKDKRTEYAGNIPLKIQYYIDIIKDTLKLIAISYILYHHFLIH